MRSLLCLLPLASGCLAAPRLPAAWTIDQVAELGTPIGLGAGATLNFDATLTENGETREVTYWPRQTLAVVQMISLHVRHAFNEHCDAGADLRVGTVGGDVRCGLGNGTWELALSSGFEAAWWHGLIGRTEIQAGARADGWLVFLSSGISAATYGHKVALEGFQLHDGENLLSGPPDPSVVIHQRELASSSSLILGVPFHEGSVILGGSVELPFARSTPRFTCHGCGERFEDFDPGWRLGVIVGLVY